MIGFIKMPSNIVNIILIYLLFEIIVETKSDENVYFNSSNTDSFNIEHDNSNDTNIVGGFIAQKDQFPYLVAIQQLEDNEFAHVCGGSIIGSHLVLTAAHCFIIPIIPGDYMLLAGTISLIVKNAHQSLKVAAVHMHPKYVSIVSGNDIAIMKTVDRFIFSKHIKPIKLASKSVPENTTCLSSGWGAVTPNGRVFKDRLKGLVMRTRNSSDCSDFVHLNTKRLRVICAGGVVSEDTCSGDSGGPLVCNDEQYGILSFGDAECGVGIPAYFSDVTAFNEWVTKISEMKNETAVHYKTLLMVLQLITTSFALILSN